jgi:hypothetical protein
MKPLPESVADARDRQLAHKLRAQGVSNSLRIVLECRHRHQHVLPVSLGLALQEQESGGANIFGADIGGLFPHQPVTKERVLQLVDHVRAGGVSNGVGPFQLTFIGFLDEANRDGGAWEPAVNIATGLGIIADHIRQHGVRGGLAAYNAGTPTAAKGLKYADHVMLELQPRFHAMCE